MGGVPHRDLAHGPELHPDGSVTFRVWAPRADRVTLVLRDEELPMQDAGGGWRRAVTGAVHGDEYGYRLDGGALLPDPASRWQPHGVHGLSRLLDTATLGVGDHDLRAPGLGRAVIYELHVGAFSEEGTFAAAVPHLRALADLGVTHVELMPVNAFNGVHGWGYDGVCWWAVHEPYGGPPGLAAFVDAAHRTGLAVVLDVVHNHLGPSGNYLAEFGPYLTDRYRTDWGPAVNLDGPGSDEVRSFVVGSALWWLRHYRVDALRLDAVHDLVDTSATHVLAELSDAVAALATDTGKRLQLVAESDRNDPATLLPTAQGGLGMDAQWADDLHHSMHVAVTGEDEGWYADYRGLPDVARAYRHGFVFDGTRFSGYRGRTVGAPLPDDVPGWRLVGCVQNHDQVGNRATGARLVALAGDELVRVAALLLCAAPHTPMLFMGEEYGEDRPFLFFTSHPEPELAEAVREGRYREFGAFTGFAGAVPDPQDPATFERSRLDRAAATTSRGAAWRSLWADLLAMRDTHPVLRDGRRDLVRVLVEEPRRLAVVRGDDARSAALVAANLADATTAFEVPGRADWVPGVDTADERYGGSGRTAAVEPVAGGSKVTLGPRSGAVWLSPPPR